MPVALAITLLASVPDARAQSAEATPASCAGADLRPDGSNDAAIEASTICLINEARVGWGLRPLGPNRYLRSVAAGQVAAMLRWGYFGDVRPSGQTPSGLVASTRYGFNQRLLTGEDLGWGTFTDTTPASMVAAWMASPGHRENILYPPYRDIGVDMTAQLPPVLPGSEPGATYAVEFAVRTPRRRVGHSTTAPATVTVPVTAVAARQAPSG